MRTHSCRPAGRILSVAYRFLLAIACVALATNLCAADSPRERPSLDAGWKFHLGDIPLDSFPGGQGVNLYAPDITCHGAKAGCVWGAAARGFDDANWRQVCLPHDWAVEQPFDFKQLKQQGHRPRGIGWYRRTLKLDTSDRGKNIELQFDGVATHYAVYFNGSRVHHNFYGYTSFHIDVTSMVRDGNDENTIAVRVDADAMEGWWYEGSGIYRHIWLAKRSPVHVVTDGVYANPVKGADGKWTIPAEVTLANTGADAASAMGRALRRLRPHRDDRRKRADQPVLDRRQRCDRLQSLPRCGVRLREFQCTGRHRHVLHRCRPQQRHHLLLSSSRREQLRAVRLPARGPRNDARGQPGPDEVPLRNRHASLVEKLVSQANTTHSFALEVSDKGSPPLTATRSFSVTVNPLVTPTIGNLTFAGGQFSLQVNGQTGPDYRIETSTNLTHWTPVHTANSPTMPFTWTHADTGGTTQRFYRVKVGPPLEP